MIAARAAAGQYDDISTKSGALAAAAGKDWSTNWSRRQSYHRNTIAALVAASGCAASAQLVLCPDSNLIEYYDPPATVGPAGRPAASRISDGTNAVLCARRTPVTYRFRNDASVAAGFTAVAFDEVISCLW